MGTDPDMTLRGILGQANPLPWVELQATSIEISQTAECLSDTNVTAGGDLEPGPPCGFWWQQSPWTSTEALAVERLETNLVLGSS